MTITTHEPPEGEVQPAVQNALTALIPIKDEDVASVRALIDGGGVGPGGLDDVGTVHFARIFVMPENNAAGIDSNLVAVITSYDDDFARYIQAFVNQETVANIFNVLLQSAADPDAAALIPVQKNAAAFAAWVKKYDLTNGADSADPAKAGFWYSAYPTKTVKDILAS